MTRIDFYLLDAKAHGDRFQLCCRIAEKARRAGQRVLIHTPLEAEVTHINGLLWTYWEQGFVPHGLLGRDDPALNPIMIGDGSKDEAEHGVLINLEAGVPLFFSRFERLIECLDHDEAVKAAGRERFRYYREHGYPLETHTVD
jgi:DNA polymerase-3 subunit chi